MVSTPLQPGRTHDASHGASDPALRLKALYRGRPDIQGTEDGGYLRRPVTVGHFRGHLQGRFGLGIYPLREDGMCAWATIDIDVSDIDGAALLRRLLSDAGLTAILLTSTQKGYHVTVFFSGWVRAAAVRPILQKQVIEAGLSPKTEIYPKTGYVDADSKAPGGYVRLPYIGALAAADGQARYKAADGRRVALDPAILRPLLLEEFLALAEANRVAPDVVRQLAEDELPSARLDEVIPSPQVGCADHLRIPAEYRELIKQGWAPHSKYRTRSEAQQAVVDALVNAGYDDIVVRTVLTDPRCKISDRTLKMRARHREDAIQRCITKARETRVPCIIPARHLGFPIELHDRMVVAGLPSLAWPVLVEVLRLVDPGTGLSQATGRSIAKRLGRDVTTVYRSGLTPLREHSILEAVPLRRAAGRWYRVAHRVMPVDARQPLAQGGGPSSPGRECEIESVAGLQHGDNETPDLRVVTNSHVAPARHGAVANSGTTAGHSGL